MTIRELKKIIELVGSDDVEISVKQVRTDPFYDSDYVTSIPVVSVEIGRDIFTIWGQKDE